MIEFRILGPLEAREDGRLIELGRQKQRALLALLLLRRGELVSTDALVEGLWGEEPPRTARAALQNAVSQLRAALGPDVVVSGTGGYMLDVGAEQLDLSRFERLVAEGRNELGEERARMLRAALALWRGPPLAGLEFEPFAALECARLEELRAAAVEELVDAELALGSGPELVAELETLIGRHPFRERLRGQLMLALYRAGRQVEALEAYQETRRTLVDELGIEPGEPLRELEQRILRHDPRLASHKAAERRTLGAPRRKTVTVLLVEVLGGESLDAELLPATSGRILSRIRSILETYGASIEQRAGEEVMAIFGIPRVHEDDALRAARAALELRLEAEALAPALARAGRIGADVRVAVETGEVLAGDDAAGHGFIIGPAVGRAKRLLESAQAGEIMLGSASAKLLAEAGVAVAPGGKGDGSLLLDAAAAAAQTPSRRLDTPLLGREVELSTLETVFMHVQTERLCRVVLVVGEPGIGKTRLTQELSERLASAARVVIGHCAPYGEGVAYLPVVEIIRAVRRTAPLGTLLAEEPDSELVERILSELAADAIAGSSQGEQWWAVRRLLEALAATRPLLVVLEDLQWAEPGLLELIEEVERRTRAPVLVVAATRPELLDSRPELVSKETVRLGPLPDDVCGELVANLGTISQDVATRVVDTAGGNPLFLEQLLAYTSEQGAGDRIPPSLEALLGARLDRLSRREHSVLQRAAVAGTEFSLEAVEALSPDADLDAVESDVGELSRKGLVRPNGPPGAERPFRFHHVLIRDEAYRSIPRQLRSQLHERLADWLESRPATAEELVGYHLEQAYRCTTDHGPRSGRAQRLAAAAGDHLGVAGLRAARSGETHGAANLLGRATALVAPAEAARRDLLTELGLVLWRRGEVESAETTLEHALSAAREERDRRAELRAALELANLRLFLTPEGGADHVLAVAEEAIPVLEMLDDERSLGRIWYAVAFVRGGLHCRYRESAEAAERARRSFRRSGWPVAPCLQELAAALYYGPTSVEYGLQASEELAAEADLGGRANVLAFRAGLEAMAGRFDDARETARRAREIYEELGWTINVWTNCATVAGDIELSAGDAASAETIFSESCQKLEAWGERAHLATQAAQLGEALYRQGRYDEVLRWSQLAAECAASDDAGAQFLWRALSAKSAARQGQGEEADSLSREAVARAAKTDASSQHAQVLVDRAEVLRLSGQWAAAQTAIRQALGLLQAKGNIAALQRTRSLLRDAPDS